MRMIQRRKVTHRTKRGEALKSLKAIIVMQNQFNNNEIKLHFYEIMNVPRKLLQSKIRELTKK